MESAIPARILSVMMPIYNEEATLPIILSHFLDRPEVGEVIAVDDGSKDASYEILQRVAAKDSRLRVFQQVPNQGKGAALRRAVTEISLPYALVQDADLEYDPRDYPVLLEPLIEQRADVVYGVRGFASHTSYSYWFVKGNQLVTWATNVLFDCYVSDMETGYKVLRSELWKRLNLRGNRFDIEPDITARILRLRYRIHEVPVRYYARSREDGKKLTWQDGIRALTALLRLRLTSHARLYGDSLDDEFHRARQRELAQHHPLLKDTLPPARRADARDPARLGID